MTKLNSNNNPEDTEVLHDPFEAALARQKAYLENSEKSNEKAEQSTAEKPETQKPEETAESPVVTEKQIAAAPEKALSANTITQFTRPTDQQAVDPAVYVTQLQQSASYFGVAVSPDMLNVKPPEKALKNLILIVGQCANKALLSPNTSFKNLVDVITEAKNVSIHTIEED